MFKPLPISLAAGVLCTSLAVSAQTAAPAAAPSASAPQAQTLEKVTITGSLIKRSDKETPSLVEVISREEITKSGFATVEELLRNKGIADSGWSVNDGLSSGFVSGVSTISMRGFGSQGTLVLINGRRIAPVAAIDVNFGRANLVSVNTIPKGALERIDVLKDGASALYGSDAMAGVVNYVLRKEYKGIEASGNYTANDRNVGATKTANISFGFGDRASSNYNIFGGLEVFQRDRVTYSQLTDRGENATRMYFRTLSTPPNTDPMYAPGTSVSSPYASYYKVPTTYTGAPTAVDRLTGQTVPATSFYNANNYLGTMPGCPDSLVVGKGQPARLPSMLNTDPSFLDGQCRFPTNTDAEAVGEQKRVAMSLRGTYDFSPTLSAYGEVSYNRTETKNIDSLNGYVLTQTLYTASTWQKAVSWTTPAGTLNFAPALVLGPTHRDNPTRGTANAQAVQLLYRFDNMPQTFSMKLDSVRAVAGVEGTLGEWDIDSAFVWSQQKSESRRARLQASKLLNALTNDTAFDWNGPNSAEATATLYGWATNKGNAETKSIDIRASRELFKMPGGRAAVALGAEYRDESLDAVPDDAFRAGDYIGLVANSASGTRKTTALFSELRLPVHKRVELQAAARYENSSDYGSSTTGKLGFKWDVVSGFALRGTAATGFRAPGISQISKSASLSFHSFSEYAVPDPLRCDTSNPDSSRWVSRAPNPVARDCNLLNYNFGLARVIQPGSMATVIAGNPNIKPETSRSLTLGFLASPTRYIDLSIDGWYFERQSEIRVQRGVDMLGLYFADPVANANLVTRDPNPATWLVDPVTKAPIPNSGPILMVQRQWGNFEYTKTSGVDYDVRVRFPATSFGKVSVGLSGTMTNRFDVKQASYLARADWLDSWSFSGVPRSRNTVSLDWSKGNWSAWGRMNHIDSMSTTSVATCQRGATAQNKFLADRGWCGAQTDVNYDIGMGYRGIRNLTMNLAILNVTGEMASVGAVPTAEGASGNVLGRRLSLSASYKFR